MSVSLLPAKKRRERQRRFGFSCVVARGGSVKGGLVRASREEREEEALNLKGNHSAILHRSRLPRSGFLFFSSFFCQNRKSTRTSSFLMYHCTIRGERDRRGEEDTKSSAPRCTVLSVYLSIDHRQREKRPPVTERTIQGRIDGADRAHKCMMTEREGTFWWREGRWEGQAAGSSRSRNNCTKDGQWPHEMKMEFAGSLI